MFASYKGEGTGAVLYMLAHHILKPERLPLEAHLWGTRKSSGSFLTMFDGTNLACSRLRRGSIRNATERIPKNRQAKAHGLSEPLGFEIAATYLEFLTGKKVLLVLGDSGSTDLADGSVDIIITYPPFFDNVQYSQLEDFSHVWQRHILGKYGYRESHTTRSTQEVQNSDATQFTTCGAVWAEAHCVLKNTGIFAFNYHHSRAEGWHLVLEALTTAGFGITAAQPIKAEMSVAMPKRQAKEPIDLDIILVYPKTISSDLSFTEWEFVGYGYANCRPTGDALPSKRSKA